jgi:hypothetical protein
MEGKPNYQQELLERCGRWWVQVEDAIAKESLIKFDWPKILHDFVKQVALDSFKNGIDAGQRRAAGHSGYSRRPRRAPAHVKGTALESGRLKPVEREPNDEDEGDDE